MDWFIQVKRAAGGDEDDEEVEKGGEFVREDGEQPLAFKSKAPRLRGEKRHIRIGGKDDKVG